MAQSYLLKQGIQRNLELSTSVKKNAKSFQQGVHSRQGKKLAQAFCARAI